MAVVLALVEGSWTFAAVLTQAFGLSLCCIIALYIRRHTSQAPIHGALLSATAIRGERLHRYAGEDQTRCRL